MPSRREVLKSAGKALTVPTVALVGSSIAAATRTDYIPSHATIDFNKSWLETYRPELLMRAEDREKFLGMYAWRVTSTEYGTDVGVYWCSYSHQDGVTDYDSHYGDHEPCYVFVNSDTGDVKTVVASIYHWVRGKASAGSVPMNDTHPRLRVVNPHHQYTAALESETTRLESIEKLGTEAGLEDEQIETEFESWLSNGLDKSLAPGTVVDPWTMLSRGHWWRKGSFGVSTTATLVGLRRSLGVGVVGDLTGSVEGESSWF